METNEGLLKRLSDKLTYFMTQAKTIDSTQELLRFLKTPLVMSQGGPVLLLSKQYPSIDNTEFLDDFQSLIWITYRSQFPPVKHQSYTNDSGWGCMLRSGQMLLANCLKIHLLGRDWQVARIEQGDWLPYASIIYKFLDSPTASYSIQRIALEGQRFGKEVGEWFGPSTISQVIQAVVNSDGTLGVYVSLDGIMFRNEARAELERKSECGDERDALLVLVNVRLGLDELNPVYKPLIKKCFELPSFMGIAGGRPNSSMYFVGCQGDNLLYLDPHIMRPSVPLKDIHSYKKEELFSYHCERVRLLSLNDLDPSMCLGFYCKRDEFDALFEEIAQLTQGKTPLFSIEETSLDLKQIAQEIASDDDF